MKVRKDVAQVLEYAELCGFQLDKQNGKHFKLRHANGNQLTVPRTPSDFRWAKNTYSDIRRLSGCARGPARKVFGKARFKRGTGYDPCPSATEARISEVVADAYRQIAEIDRELAELPHESRTYYDRAKRLAVRRVRLAAALRSWHKPVPDFSGERADVT